jgi:RNA polymerase sigma-70 factor (ECF subfamily)
MTIAGTLEDRSSPGSVCEEPNAVGRVYRDHADFVWSCLQRFGVRDGDLDDVMQEVFVVVHRKLPSFRGDARLTTWLYSICLRVATAYRRRFRARAEELPGDTWEVAERGERSDPEGDLALSQRRRALSTILDQLDLEKRAVFVMFEIDELPCEEIAAIMGVPVGTVYSRLHAARKAFQKATTRFRARLEEMP